ncbi:MAG: winged helix-turn-helix domain-containing protein [Muribaculaceae bacterium]|nr:winged helix-turn-helix domain-containing protein [Muribaculaceae bacterium]
MNTEVIGTNAGAVWTALNTADALGVKQIKKMTKLKDKEVYAALGWLAREGKVNIVPDSEDEKELIVSLVQDK